MMRQEIPLLNQVHIEKPCTADWDAMTAVQGEQVKHCAHCQKNVYNLSAMTNTEAETLLAQMPNLCVRYSKNDEGQILTEEVLPVSRPSKLPAHWLFRFAASIVAIITGFIAHPALADTIHKAKTPPRKPTKAQSRPKIFMGKRKPEKYILGRRIAPATKPKVEKVHPEQVPQTLMGIPTVPNKDQTKQKLHIDSGDGKTLMGSIGNVY